MPTDEEWAFYAEKREGFEMLYHGKYVLISGRTLIGVYDHQDDVFKEAGLRFAATGCLIRHVGYETDRDARPSTKRPDPTSRERQ